MCTGKTTLGNCVRERAHHGAYVKLSFATRIKQLAVELFDMPPGTKDRDLLCYIGAAMRALMLDDFRSVGELFLRQIGVDPPRLAPLLGVELLPEKPFWTPQQWRRSGDD